jgi:hypothetical protein
LILYLGQTLSSFVQLHIVLVKEDSRSYYISYIIYFSLSQSYRILSYVRFQDGTILLQEKNTDATIEILTTFPHPGYNRQSRMYNIMLVQLATSVESPLSSSMTGENMFVQLVLDDIATTSHPSRWPVPILQEGQSLLGFNYCQSTRYSNDVKDNIVVNNQWGNWKLGYVGKEKCMEQTDGASTYEGVFADDSFCIERRDDNRLSSSSSSSSSYVAAMCQPGELGGPILWISKTTNARLLLGMNTWGNGCLSANLPDVAGLVSVGSDFIRSVICEESINPPSYMGCAQSTEIPLPTTSMSSGVVGGVLSGKNSFATKVTTTASRVGELDFVTVYILFLFDSTTAENISWTISETTSNVLVASAIDGTYTSDTDFVTDFTELVSLIPGKSYSLQITDGSVLSSSDIAVGNTDFTIVISEPPQEVRSGQVGQGTTQSYTFTVPDGREGEQVEEEEEEEEEIATTSVTVTPTETTSSTSSPPSMTPVTTATIITDSPTLSCEKRGELCESNNDCCSQRCSISKQCAASTSGGRDKVSGGSSYGGSASGGGSSKRDAVNYNFVDSF